LSLRDDSHAFRSLLAELLNSVLHLVQDRLRNGGFESCHRGCVIVRLSVYGIVMKPFRRISAFAVLDDSQLQDVGTEWSSLVPQDIEAA
jgi:hypothetical protein